MLLLHHLNAACASVNHPVAPFVDYSYVEFGATHLRYHRIILLLQYLDGVARPRRHAVVSVTGARRLLELEGRLLRSLLFIGALNDRLRAEGRLSDDTERQS